MPDLSPVRRRARRGAFPVALVAVAVLATGCAQRLDTPTAAPVAPVAPAGYACSTGAIFTQPIEVPVRQVATLGDTTAVLTGTSASDAVEPSALTRATLTLTTPGRPPIISALTPPTGASGVDLFTLQTEAQHASTTVADVDTDGSLCLVRFSAGAAPVALVALTLGGVHCCVTVRAIAADGAAPIDHAFGNYAPYLDETSAGPVLVSYDDAFANAFVSFASSAPPVRVFGWLDGGLVDVTSAHLDLVRADATEHLGWFNDLTQPERLGFLPGWLADECVVGNAPAAWDFVNQQFTTGALDSSPFTTPADFIARLRALVVSRGYCPN